MFDDKVLMVDDESNLLQAYKRQFHSKLNLVTAVGPEAGLAALYDQGPFSVVISDMKMPGMDGVNFLSQVRQYQPDAVRMLLTGQSTMEDAANLINSGGVFRFLTKPCPPVVMAKTIIEAIQQHHRDKAEKDLLENTLRSSVKVLSEVLSLSSPTAFSRTARLTQLAEGMLKELDLENSWEYEIAGLLSQIGCIAIPEEILTRTHQGDELSSEERKVYNSHPRVAFKLLRKIPRLENVADIIRYQNIPNSELVKLLQDDNDAVVFWGAAIMKVALAYDRLTHDAKMPAIKAIALITKKQTEGFYQGSVVNALKASLEQDHKYEMARVGVKKLEPGMIIAEEVKTKEGQLLVGQGQEVTESLCTRLENMMLNTPIQEPIQVIKTSQE